MQRRQPGIQFGNQANARSHHPPPDFRQLVIPEDEGGDLRFLGPDGAQQGVALVEDAGELRQVRGSRETAG
jgi:hypothetical protein